MFIHNNNSFISSRTNFAHCTSYSCFISLFIDFRAIKIIFEIWIRVFPIFYICQSVVSRIGFSYLITTRNPNDEVIRNDSFIFCSVKILFCFCITIEFSIGMLCNKFTHSFKVVIVNKLSTYMRSEAADHIMIEKIS